MSVNTRIQDYLLQYSQFGYTEVMQGSREQKIKTKLDIAKKMKVCRVVDNTYIINHNNEIMGILKDNVVYYNYTVYEQAFVEYFKNQVEYLQISIDIQNVYEVLFRNNPQRLDIIKKSLASSTEQYLVSANNGYEVGMGYYAKNVKEYEILIYLCTKD